MKFQLDNRFPEVPHCVDVDWLKKVLVREKHVLFCLDKWNSWELDEMCKTHAGGSGPDDFLGWDYNFSPKGLTIRYPIFHELEEDDLEGLDYSDSCDLYVTYTKKEVMAIISKQNQHKLF